MPDKGWSRTFADPIILPNGCELHTLRDAGNYIASLPKREHDKPAWLTAIRSLMLVVENGGDTMRRASARYGLLLSQGTWPHSIAIR